MTLQIEKRLIDTKSPFTWTNHTVGAIQGPLSCHLLGCDSVLCLPRWAHRMWDCLLHWGSHTSRLQNLKVKQVKHIFNSST